jgi:hypothetical protein
MMALTLLSANPSMVGPPLTPAPPGSADTRYCLRVDPLIGSHIETIQYKTRDEWVMLGIDVDEEWAENGVRVIGPVTG